VRWVDVVLSSPFVRAWRTAELLEDEAGDTDPLRSARSGPLAARSVQALQPFTSSAALAKLMRAIAK
jgi:phosphohistidine phosphatase SixA